MRVTEFLVEYNVEITMRTYGPKILARAKNPGNPDFSKFRPANDQSILNMVQGYLEGADPTYNEQAKTGGKYIPWLARQYADGKVFRLEDLFTLSEPLRRFDRYKVRKDFSTKHTTDINRLSASQLIDVMSEYTPAEQDRGKYKVVYDDARVSVIVPEDEQASRFWGSPHWCTSGESCYRFQYYTDQGPLFILIPKNPHHAGEKYQIHFETDQIMDERDRPVSLRDLLVDGFGPGLYNFFVKNYKDKFENNMSFVNPPLLEVCARAVAEDAITQAQRMNTNFGRIIKKDFTDHLNYDSLMRASYDVTSITGEALRIFQTPALFIHLLEDLYVPNSEPDYGIDVNSYEFQKYSQDLNEYLQRLKVTTNAERARRLVFPKVIPDSERYGGVPYYLGLVSAT